MRKNKHVKVSPSPAYQEGVRNPLKPLIVNDGPATDKQIYFLQTLQRDLLNHGADLKQIGRKLRELKPDLRNLDLERTPKRAKLTKSQASKMIELLQPLREIALKGR